MALTDGYTAPLNLYKHLHHVMQKTPSIGRSNRSDNDEGTSASTRLVCTCAEWCRFPSSYYLPDDASLAFLKSSFDNLSPYMGASMI
eukprot:scaffold266166_cov63-Attheya_sp.AAC.4